MPRFTAFHAFTRVAHSSSRAIRLDSNDGARANHSSVTGRALEGVASDSTRRARLSRLRLGSQPVSRASAARYSEKRAIAAPRSPDRYRASTASLAASSDSGSHLSQRSASSMASRQRHWPIASRARVPRACSYCCRSSLRVAATHSSNWGACRTEKPARNRGISVVSTR